MARQRMFTLYVAIAVFVLLIIFYNPARSTIEPVYTPKPHIGDAVKVNDPIKELSHQAPAVPPFVADEPTTKAAVVEPTKPAVVEPTKPAALEPDTKVAAIQHDTKIAAVQHDTKIAAVEHPTKIAVETTHAPAITQKPVASLVHGGGFDDLDRSVTGDEYAYLTLTTSESIDPFGYLSATTSESIDGYAYLATSAGIMKPHPTQSEAAKHNGLISVGKGNAELEQETDDTDLWKEKGKWFFQEPMKEYTNPKFDVEKMKSYAPHNWKGPGHEAYATFLSTRNSSLDDPYFLATQQQIYRLLWHPKIQTKGRPFVVFVAPHIPQIQRDYLLAAGAMVRELDIITYRPTEVTNASPRWRDMFSKLNFWSQIEFSRLLYIDVDAFPLVSIDALFETAKEQQCKPDLLEAEDKAVITDICSYTFMCAVEEEGELNAGMMLISPNKAMHRRLLRESANTDKFSFDMMEQTFIRYAFGAESPFPAQTVERKWNAVKTEQEDEGKVNVLHEKMWNWALKDHFSKNYFRETWDEMIKLYETQEFAGMRAKDGAVEKTAAKIVS